MSEKYLNKYRSDSSRLPNYDYGSIGAYFITICTQNREQYFGTIDNQKMHLNEIGLLAKKLWIEIPTVFPFIRLDEFVIMPDHIHGILVIDNPGSYVETRLIASQQLLLIAPQQTPQTQSMQLTPQVNKGGITGNHNPMYHDNISRVIRWYKGRCSFEIRKIQNEFYWQSRFYDHIIRNQLSFENIRNYIQKNPEKWQG